MVKIKSLLGKVVLPVVGLLSASGCTGIFPQTSNVYTFDYQGQKASVVLSHEPLDFAGVKDRYFLRMANGDAVRNGTFTTDDRKEVTVRGDSYQVTDSPLHSD